MTSRPTSNMADKCLITKEWLLKTIAELEEERDSVPGVVNEDAAMSLAAMKIALASLEVEPVAWLWTHPERENDVSLTTPHNDEDAEDAMACGWSVQPLYTAMLQGAERVTTAYKLPFEQWLLQQTGTIDVECGCVMTEVFFHWLRVAYEAGNSPVVLDGACPCCGRKQLKNRTCSVSGCDGKHVAHGFCKKHYDIERKKDPSRRESIRAADKRYRARKAAAPQQEVK